MKIRVFRVVCRSVLGNDFDLEFRFSNYYAAEECFKNFLDNEALKHQFWCIAVLKNKTPLLSYNNFLLTNY